MNLISIATASPPHSYSQPDTHAALQLHPGYSALKASSRSLLKKILNNKDSGLNQRQFMEPDLARVFNKDAEELNRSFEKHAPSPRYRSTHQGP